MHLSPAVGSAFSWREYARWCGQYASRRVGDGRVVNSVVKLVSSFLTIRDEPTKASWYISVTTDSNCICTVTAILPPSPPQTCHWIRCGEDSGKGDQGQAASTLGQE